MSEGKALSPAEKEERYREAEYLRAAGVPLSFEQSLWLIFAEHAVAVGARQASQPNPILQEAGIATPGVADPAEARGRK